MKIRNILIYTFAVFCSVPTAVHAQVTLSDKASQKVDLGYGVEQSEFLTTAATTTITAEELRRTSAISLADALYGKLPGLNAYQNTGFKGEEGRGATFNIRGVQTTGERDILILVDGVERPIDRLTVEEVESVTVLKDAAAVALYGHEAINGVLLVKTKHGNKDGKNHFKVGASHKFQFDPKMADMVSAYDYASALNRARLNDGLGAAYTDAELQKFADGSDPFVYPNVNWKKEVFKNTAHESNAFLSFYGGTDKVQYYTHLDYTDARGLYKNPKQDDWTSQLKYSKANIRANLDFEVSNTTRVSANILGILMETNGVPNVDSNDAWWHLYKVPALAFPIRTANGVWGGSQTYGDFNLLAKSQGAGFMKTPELSVFEAQKEITAFSERMQLMFNMVGELLDLSSSISPKKKKDSKAGDFDKLYARIEKYEDISDNMELEIAKYLDSVSDAHLSDETKAKIRAMLREISELESIGDACYNMARTINRKFNGKQDHFTEEQYEHIHQMMSLTDQSLSEMNRLMGGRKESYDMNRTVNIENEINNYRAQLKSQNINDINNHQYTYAVGTIYMDLINECEKLGDYVVNVVEARMGTRLRGV